MLQESMIRNAILNTLNQHEYFSIHDILPMLTKLFGYYVEGHYFTLFNQIIAQLEMSELIAGIELANGQQGFMKGRRL